METQIELSDDARKRLEEIALAAFHNLMIGVVDNYLKQMDLSNQYVAMMQTGGVERVLDEIRTTEQSNQ